MDDPYDDPSNFESYRLDEGKDESLIFRAPFFRITHGYLSIPPDNLDDDEPVMPAIYIEMKRDSETEDEARLIVMAPQAAFVMAMHLLTQYKLALDAIPMPPLKGGDDVDGV